MLCIGIATAGTKNEERVHLARLPPDSRGGQAYRLTYHVPLPLDIFWRFKTDFNNTFLEDNKYILKHRLISSRGNVVVTEDIYTSRPSERFRWQTTIFSKDHRLEFKLLDTQTHHQKFHYGFIQLQAEGRSTRVTQTAYFDFFGASIWAIIPWDGGMKPFLEYTANWERETAVRLRHHYMAKQPEENTAAEQMKK